MPATTSTVASRTVAYASTRACGSTVVTAMVLVVVLTGVLLVGVGVVATTIAERT
jgi:hypothetical protein